MAEVLQASIAANTNPVRVTIVLVNFFKAQRLVEGLRSLYAQDVSEPISVVVFDNSCDPGERELLASEQKIQKFKLVVSKTNLGYPAACNCAVAGALPSRYILLVNPDIIWEGTNSLRNLLAVASEIPSLGVLAPLQMNDDGSIAEIVRKFPTPVEQIQRRIFKGPAQETEMLQSLLQAKQPTTMSADWLQSSCVLVSRQLWEHTGGLDEGYFLFMSDVELCLAAWQCGFTVNITSAARVRGDGVRASRGAIGALLTSWVQRVHARDAFRYYYKHGFRRQARGALNPRLA